MVVKTERERQRQRERNQIKSVVVLRLLDYCVNNGAYTGCEFNKDEEDAEDLLTRLSDLKLDGTMIVCLLF